MALRINTNCSYSSAVYARRVVARTVLPRVSFMCVCVSSMLRGFSHFFTDFVIQKIWHSVKSFCKKKNNGLNFFYFSSKNRQKNHDTHTHTHTFIFILINSWSVKKTRWDNCVQRELPLNVTLLHDWLRSGHLHLLTSDYGRALIRRSRGSRIILRRSVP